MNETHTAQPPRSRKTGIETTVLGEGVETGTDEGTDQGYLDSLTQSHPDSSLNSREDQIDDPERSAGADSPI
jgi:hypothetical protein